MQLPPETLASAEKALREQLRPVIRRALAGATADVLAEGGILAALGVATDGLPKVAPTDPVEPHPPSTHHRSPTSRSDGPAAEKRIRRTPEELEALATKFVAYVNKNPGTRAPAIAEHLGMSVEKLRTIQAMIKGTGEISTTGTKVHTQYWPVGKAPKTDKKARKAG